METVTIIIDLVLAVAAALIGGAIAQRLRQPVIIGYLLAGVAIGPANPLTAGALAEMPALADIGVALLMFALGLEFNLARIRLVRDVAIWGGLAQILLTGALGAGIGLLFAFSLPTSLFLGSLIALSSTAIVLKTLSDRGELTALQGQIAVGFLIIQDLSVVPMMIILPELSHPGGNLTASLAIAAAKAAGFLIITYLVGTRLVPRLLFWIAETGSRELFLLAIFTLALGAALLTQLVGLSLTFGAFIAGLIVAESEFSYQAIGEVGPIRDLFATLFFVSVGMFIDPLFLIQNLAPIALLVVAIIFGKFVIGAAIPWFFGYPAGVALATGLAIAQIGEFSFVLARVGVESGAIDRAIYGLTLSAALVTMLLSPVVMPWGPPIQGVLARLPGLGRIFREGPGRSSPGSETLTNHVVICGFGRVGQELAESLERRGFRFLVIDYNPRLVGHLRNAGTPYLYGNCANEAVLERAGLERARLLAIAVPDAISAAETTRLARHLNRRLDIIVRSHSLEEMERLREAGATEAVLPEFEAGLEFVRHTLRRFGVSGQEIQSHISARRTTYYRR